MSPALNEGSILERFEHSNASEIRNGIMFDFYPGLPHVSYMYFHPFKQNCLSSPHKWLNMELVGRNTQLIVTWCSSQCWCSINLLPVLLLHANNLFSTFCFQRENVMRLNEKDYEILRLDFNSMTFQNKDCEYQLQECSTVGKSIYILCWYR